MRSRAKITAQDFARDRMREENTNETSVARDLGIDRWAFRRWLQHSTTRAKGGPNVDAIAQRFGLPIVAVVFPNRPIRALVRTEEKAIAKLATA